MYLLNKKVNPFILLNYHFFFEIISVISCVIKNSQKSNVASDRILKYE